MSNDAMPVGSTIYVNSTSAPPGYVKENGVLLSRASFPALWDYANASGNIVSEAAWASRRKQRRVLDGRSVDDLPNFDARREFFRATTTARRGRRRPPAWPAGG
ncbi:hypothetical protein [Bradyrhizobium sp. STM 3561]|uniref:hypothetical protein n=1 Tax=unclassified Bradyrhizobium TaxID=2631580 RepID=UPI00388EEEB9